MKWIVLQSAQIDARLLKAVAIEHSTDVDAAANAVLTEILPFWSKLAVTSSSPSEVQVASSYLSKDQSDSSASCTTSKDQRIGDLSDVDGGNAAFIKVCLILNSNPNISKFC